MHDHLLAPIRIGAMTLRNRIVMAPMGVEIVGGDGAVTDEVVAYYEERARGGVGLIVTEVAAFDYPHGANSAHQLAVSDDRFVAGLRRLTDAVHAHDTRIALQLVHHGKVSRLDTKAGRPVAVPSIPEWPGSLDLINDLSDDELIAMAGASGGPATYHEITPDEITALTGRLGDAVARAVEAGFDAVEIHAAHGYLFSGFLSPQWNRRTDEYGGSPENRARIVVDAVREAKRRAGNDVPVWCRIDALEYRTPDGITFEQARETAGLLVAAGSDAVHLSAYGDMTSGPAFTEGTLPDREAKHAALSGVLTRDLPVPVIAVGRIRPAVGDEMIAHRKADAVAMGRQLLADPATALKLTERRDAEIRPCINCYACVARPFFDERVTCTVNPVVGHELALADVERTTTARPRHVVIVGGGPAGMEAARVAALRGHRVTLFEAAPHLGGALRLAGLLYEPNRRLLEWYEHELGRLPVDVRLGTAAGPQRVAALDPDVLLVATGAVRRRSILPGADLPHVLDGDDLREVLSGGGDGAAMAKLSWSARLAVRAGRRIGLLDDPEQIARWSHTYLPLGDRVVVIGGGLVGVELAEFLAERDRAVTVLETGDRLALEMAHPRRWRVLDDLRTHGVGLVTGAADIRIEADRVGWQTTDEAGATTPAEAPADTVILATGLEADPTAAGPLRAAGLDPIVIGDAAEVGYLGGAIHAGFAAVAEL